MHTIDFAPGMHIARAAEQLVEAANQHGGAEGRFNDVLLQAWPPHTTAAGLVAYYDQECQFRAEAYRQSPEGQEAARKSDADRCAMQTKHDALMRRLPSLDLYDQPAVLDWLCQMQEPSDRVGVIVRRKTIVEAFEKAGYEANENCGEAFRPDDRKNVFRYLVGQALSGLKEGPAIHPIIHKFAAEWRAKFVPQPVHAE